MNANTNANFPAIVLCTEKSENIPLQKGSADLTDNTSGFSNKMLVVK